MALSKDLALGSVTLSSQDLDDLVWAIDLSMLWRLHMLKVLRQLLRSWVVVCVLSFSLSCFLDCTLPRI